MKTSPLDRSSAAANPPAAGAEVTRGAETGVVRRLEARFERHVRGPLIKDYAAELAEFLAPPEDALRGALAHPEAGERLTEAAELLAADSETDAASRYALDVLIAHLETQAELERRMTALLRL